MNVGKTFYAKSRREWRAWLAKHHKSMSEIWLIYYKKHSGKPRIPYNDAVDEALCYGWIDSLLKPIDEFCYAQRYSPRKPTSKLSDMNRERVRRLIKAGADDEGGTRRHSARRHERHEDPWRHYPRLEKGRHHLAQLPAFPRVLQTNSCRLD